MAGRRVRRRGGRVIALTLALFLYLVFRGDGTLHLQVAGVIRRGNDPGRIVPNSLISVDEAEVVGALDPVLLGRTHAPGPGRLEGSVGELHLGGDGTTGLEVEALHVSDGLVDPTDGAGVTDGALGSFLVVEVLAEDAADAHLTDTEPLSTLGVAHAHLLIGGGEDLDEVLAHVTLAIGERCRIGIAVETEDDTAILVRISHRTSTNTLVITLLVGRRHLGPLRRSCGHVGQRIRRLGDGSR